MRSSSPSDPGDREDRLRRCIRDLAALEAVPSMCIGRSREEAIEIVMDALPTALDCDLVLLELPGSNGRAWLRGAIVGEADLPALRASVASMATGPLVLPDGGLPLWCAEADMRTGGQPGRLVVGRSTPLHEDTDRVLIRCAANLVGTTLETANVLEAARRKDEFLAMLGHELRNPLAPILTATELLARHPSAAREQEVIERHTRHLARLVDDLLDISRVTRGHVELRNEQVSLQTVLERAAELAMPVIARSHHELRVAGAEGLTLRGDPVRLAQVFTNLLTNAAKFTPARGRIEVSVSRAGERVRVSVKDDGRGIARDKMRMIFEPFMQVDRERDSLRGGLGLGLAIVSNLVERHGGSIRVESAGPGQGSTFTVELPLVERVETRTEVAPGAAPRDRAGVRVLVVDDDTDLAELLSLALRYEGFETAVAHDAHVALETFRKFLPHAAVLDVGLPDVDGYELARTLRIEHGKGAKLIAATGYGQRTDRQRAADAGFDRHFVKPVSIDDLVSVLDEVIQSASPVHALERGSPPPEV